MPTKINLNNVFSALEDTIYCIIKLSPTFPLYETGEDIDIFCYDIDKTANSIIQSTSTYIENGYTLNSTVHSNGNHLHLDIVWKEKIEFRFDLYQDMPTYKHINIKSGFFSHVIEQRIPKKITIQKPPYTVYTPHRQDELIIRYLEYIEYFQHIPDKIKHADYILKQLEQTPSDISFIDVLHHYITIPPIDIESNRFNENKKRSFLKRLFN